MCLCSIYQLAYEYLVKHSFHGYFLARYTHFWYQFTGPLNLDRFAFPWFHFALALFEIRVLRVLGTSARFIYWCSLAGLMLAWSQCYCLSVNTSFLPLTDSLARFRCACGVLGS